MDFLTAESIINYEKTKYAIHIYPRKHIVCIDGFKYFKISHGTLNKYKHFKKTGWLITDK